MNPNDEILPIVNPDGIVIGNATRSQCHSGSMTLHPVVHLHVVKSDGSILLQKRSMTKIIQPGKWDTAVGGHIAYGETPDEALRREAEEEIGLTPNDIISVRAFNPYQMHSSVERELVYSHLALVYDSFIPRIESGETDMLKFWSREDIELKLGNNVFTPNFEDEYIRLLRHI
ncbi:MAG: NUDIX domain-containing protein [Paramuribaculum sp.]|nr:NUDIX domain-containing protein [Paramuribaculum sp.]